jgi:hypothetical protein
MMQSIKEAMAVSATSENKTNNLCKTRTLNKNATKVPPLEIFRRTSSKRPMSHSLSTSQHQEFRVPPRALGLSAQRTPRKKNE